MRPGFGWLGVVALLCAPHAAAADLCRAWSAGSSVGLLDSALVSEASGLAASRQQPGRLYHINDSGDGPFLYVSGPDGGGLRRVRLEGVDAVVDTEALALGSIGGEETIVVGDIGDNSLARQSVRLFAIPESTIREGIAPVSTIVTARYPDGAHNAEAMVMGPDGSLYLITKSWTDRNQDPKPARVYRLGPETWTHPSGETAQLEYLGELDLPTLATREKAFFSDVVTDATMSSDGTRLLILTYGYAWELALDLSSGRIPNASTMQRGRDYEVIRLKPLLGKETITYLPGDRSLLFGKEYKPDRKPSELIRVECLD